MTSYIILYDLRKQRNYDALYEAIKSYETWAHVLESTWVVKTIKSAAQIRDHLTNHIDSDDGLFVMKSGGEAAWRSVICKSEWLKENL